MGGQQDSQTLGALAAEQLVHALPGRNIHAYGGLVEKQQGGPV